MKKAANDIRTTSSGNVQQQYNNNSSDTEFVNPGMETWQRVRRNWLQVTADGKKSKGEVRAKNVDSEDVIERVFSQTGNGVLREPVPLGQMIDILIDFWEADGLYD